MSVITAMQDRFFREVFVEGLYPLGINMKTVVDIGASRGEYGVLVYPYADKIYCVEPHPTRIEELNKLVSDYHLEKMVICPYAIANASDKRTLYNLNDYGGATLLDGFKHEDEKVVVDTLTMVDFLNQYHINKVDTLKCDVEGAEIEIFTDSFPWDKVDSILVEAHSVPIDLRQVFTDKGYNVVSYKSTLIARKI